MGQPRLAPAITMRIPIAIITVHCSHQRSHRPSRPLRLRHRRPSPRVGHDGDSTRCGEQTGMTALWYTARGTGVVALLLLTATVALGAAGTARMETSRWPRLITTQLHRHLSLLVVAFVAVHVASTVLDPFAPVGWAAAIVPFSSAYRPVWLGLGAVALDLLLAVLVTSLLRARLGYRTWRAVHWLAYASWPVALWHGLGTGTDSRLTLMLGLDVACVAVVACALWQRLGLLTSVGRRIAVGAAAVAVALATAVFAMAGPLQPGWARRAGTPVRLLSGAVSAAGPHGSAEGHRRRVTTAGAGS
jgi:methionine sulfoxide reductase heme-binding subunit